jgi:hypothetical protein
MRQNSLKWRNFMHAPVARAAIAILFFAALLIAQTGSAHKGLSSDLVEASAPAASVVCKADIGDHRKSPHPYQHHHCGACILGEKDDGIDAAALLTVLIAVLVPQSETSAPWLGGRNALPPKARRFSAWSSRAPPLFFS